MKPSFDIVILGLSITSSWGNGHATTYRSLVKGLAARGYRVLFLERDMPWYAENRDQPHPAGTITEIYTSFSDLLSRFEAHVQDARVVIVGSFVHDGVRVGEWVTSVAKGRTAFYDIDTPVTLAQLENGQSEYLTPSLIRHYDAYFSFTGGPVLRLLESKYGARMARALYCSVDDDLYRPEKEPVRWDLGYLGTYSEDRQPALESLLVEPARRWPEGRFTVVGAMYPETVVWPRNVDADIHLSPRDHSTFYSAQRFSLNITREEMKKRGYSPSVRLFEAGACGVPIISDYWNGLEELFALGSEVLIAETANDTLRFLHDIPETSRKAIGHAARARILSEHTFIHRAKQLEGYLREIDDNTLSVAPRRNGRDRSVDHGLEIGLPSQQERQNPGGAAGGQSRELPDSRHLYESPGKGGGNSRADRAAAESAALPVE